MRSEPSLIPEEPLQGNDSRILFDQIQECFSKIDGLVPLLNEAQREEIRNFAQREHLTLHIEAQRADVILANMMLALELGIQVTANDAARLAYGKRREGSVMPIIVCDPSCIEIKKTMQLVIHLRKQGFNVSLPEERITELRNRARDNKNDRWISFNQFSVGPLTSKAKEARDIEHLLKDYAAAYVEGNQEINQLVNENSAFYAPMEAHVTKELADDDIGLADLELGLDEEKESEMEEISLKPLLQEVDESIEEEPVIPSTILEQAPEIYQPPIPQPYVRPKPLPTPTEATVRLEKDPELAEIAIKQGKPTKKNIREIIDAARMTKLAGFNEVKFDHDVAQTLESFLAEFSKRSRGARNFGTYGDTEMSFSKLMDGLVEVGFVKRMAQHHELNKECLDKENQPQDSTTTS